MITANFPIRFNFLADSARLNIILEADVQEHHSEVFYEVRNFRVPGHVRRIVLPEIKIRKENGQWVHTDSGQATDLSVAVGKGIDAQGNGSGDRSNEAQAGNGPGDRSNDAQAGNAPGDRSNEAQAGNANEAGPANPTDPPGTT